LVQRSSPRESTGVEFSFVLSLIAGSLGVFAIITGAMMALETRFSFRVLREEKSFLTERVQVRIAKLIGVQTAS
jgi:hypothetical protein